jgi:hypothetical protein
VVCKKHGLHSGLHLLRRPLLGLRLLTYDQFGNDYCVPPDRQEPNNYFAFMEQNRCSHNVNKARGRLR